MTKIRIIVGDKGNVDFNAPIEATDKEREQFIGLMKSLFAPSVIKEEEWIILGTGELAEIGYNILELGHQKSTKFYYEVIQ